VGRERLGSGAREQQTLPGGKVPFGGLASVTVMQSANPWQGDNISNIALVWRFDRAGEPTILVEGSVAAILVIVGHGFREDLTEMLPTEGNDGVQTFAADRADDSFDHRILPRRARSNELLFRPSGFPTPEEARTKPVPANNYLGFEKL
jgi:hypothetical protein